MNDNFYKHRFYYGYIIVAVCFLTVLLAWGMLYSYGIFFEPVLDEFGWTRAMTSGAFSLCLILTSVLSFVSGILADRFGPRVVVAGCGFFVGLGYILMSQMSTVWQFYIFYGILIGVGMSAAWVPLMSTIARWFIKRRAFVSSLVSSGFGFGMVFLPPIAAWLITKYSWNTTYAIIGTTIMVSIMGGALFLKGHPSQKELLHYGETKLHEKNPDSEDKGFSFKGALNTRQFWMVCALFFSFFFTFSAIMVHIVIHATGMGINPTNAATIISISGGVSIIGGITIGRAADRAGNKFLLIFSFLMLLASAVLLKYSSELWTFYMFGAVFGLAYGGLITLITPVTAELFGLGSIGTILGCINMVAQAGEATAPVLVGYIFDIYGSYDLVFSILIAINIMACIIAVLLTTPKLLKK